LGRSFSFHEAGEKIDSMTVSVPGPSKVGGAEANQQAREKGEPNNDRYRSRFPPEFQQIASVDTDTGELQEKGLTHCEEAEKFYRAVAASGQKVPVGMEAALDVARGSLLCTRKRSWRMTFGSWAAGPQIHGCFGAGGRKVAGGPDYIHLALNMENGCWVWRSMEEFDTSSDSVHASWPDRFFAKFVDSLLSKTRNNGARVGKAMTHVLSARELFDFALPLMKAVAADPLAAESLKERSGHSLPADGRQT
jgi:hypothetical protein